MGARADAPSLWSDVEFCHRVAERAQAIGVSVAEACTRAGLAADYLKKVPTEGRNIGSILRLAQALDIEPAILIGLRPTIELEGRRALVVANLTALVAAAMAHVSVTPLDIDVEELTKTLVKIIRDPPVNGRVKAKKPARSLGSGGQPK
jgi:transcriptional regulator with XRE-family HTH domain